jgi:hypothetical protein
MLPLHLHLHPSASAIGLGAYETCAQSHSAGPSPPKHTMCPLHPAIGVLPDQLHDPEALGRRAHESRARCDHLYCLANRKMLIHPSVHIAATVTNPARQEGHK